MEDSMDVDETLVRVKTNDGKRFSFTKPEASCSITLKRMIESSAEDGDIEIQVPVNSRMLAHILKWCREHYDDDSYASPEEGREQQAKWEKEFLGLFKEEELLKLLHAANYLDVKSLQDACCMLIAKKWEGLKIDEIRRMYGIVNDLAPEEEKQLVAENKKLGLGD